MFCQGISIPHTSQPFSQINNKLPRDYRLPRLNTMSEGIAPVQTCACSQNCRGPAFTGKTAHFNICLQYLTECSAVAAQ
eukprot:15410-Pelagomonas_calceolata.AAC.1